MCGQLIMHSKIYVQSVKGDKIITAGRQKLTVGVCVFGGWLA